jgi:hypothetical protein
MLARGLILNDTIIFDGTNYPSWKNHILCKLQTLCPNIEQFLDVGFYPLMGPQNLSVEDERNSHLEAQVSNEFALSLSPVVYVIMMASKCKMSNAIWTKLEETFGGSTSLEIDHLPKELILTSNNEDLQIASTYGCGDDPMPSIFTNM